jgi:M6 family metalloprotease-like protein
MSARSQYLNKGLLEGRRLSSGQVRGLTILVEFTDVLTNFTASDVDELLNGENYNKYDNYCSVREYFLLMSNGKLNYSNKVVGPIKLSKEREFYTIRKEKTEVLIKEVLDILVKDMGIDLYEFDSKDDHIVDALNIMYAGPPVFIGGLDPRHGIVGRIRPLKYPRKGTQIEIHYYTITALGEKPVDLNIGTFCHENGHQLCRFPDLYDYGKDGVESHGIGEFCLMGSGNHLNHGHTPSPVCSYLRYLVNWIDYEIQLNNPNEYEARHGDYGTIMKYETNNPNEFFIVENRSQLGLDKYLPASGLAVYHCDILGSGEWQGGTRDKHYQCALLQADGHFDLEKNKNRGDEGDLFKQVEGIALSHDTTPNSRKWDGSDSNLRISNISAPGQIIRFTTGEGEPLVAIGEVTANLLIPDNKPEGVSSEINISQIGRVKSIKVSIDIIHTFIGDLQVELEAPSGKKAMLHDKKGGSTIDIKETYFSDSVQTLADLEGEFVNGNWALHIKDLALNDTGRLNWWKIEMKYEAEE